MTVKELVETLKKLDQDLEVWHDADGKDLRVDEVYLETCVCKESQWEMRKVVLA